MGDVCPSPRPGKRDFSGTSWGPQLVSTANDGHADWFLTHAPGTQMPSDRLVPPMAERRGGCWAGDRLIPECAGPDVRGFLWTRRERFIRRNRTRSPMVTPKKAIWIGPTDPPNWTDHWLSLPKQGYFAPLKQLQGGEHKEPMTAFTESQL